MHVNVICMRALLYIYEFMHSARKGVACKSPSLPVPTNQRFPPSLRDLVDFSNFMAQPSLKSYSVRAARHLYNTSACIDQPLLGFMVQISIYIYIYIYMCVCMCNLYTYQCVRFFSFWGAQHAPMGEKKKSWSKIPLVLLCLSPILSLCLWRVLLQRNLLRMFEWVILLLNPFIWLITSQN